MIYNFHVTFENETNAPNTVSGTVDATGVGTAANRAIKAAKKELRGIRWSSLVVVLEKVKDAKEE